MVGEKIQQIRVSGGLVSQSLHVFRSIATIDLFQLTHLPVDKMADNLADDIFKRIFLNENVRIRIKISLYFVLKNPIDSKPALFQVMAWCRTGDKP